jgi:hypothetical protein
MSDSIAFHLQLDVSAKSEAHVTEFCIAHLRERGYHVAPPNEKWETPSEFLARLGVSAMSLHRALRRSGCPNVAAHRTPTGRILELCSNQAFDAFVKRYLKPGPPKKS